MSVPSRTAANAAPAYFNLRLTIFKLRAEAPAEDTGNPL